MKFWEMYCLGTMKSQLDFGDDMDPDLDIGTFKIICWNYALQIQCKTMPLTGL